jgi:hypothetical protein
MALAVHDPFPYNGRMLNRGDVVFGVEAEEIAHSHQAHRCSFVADEQVAHLKPKEAAPTPIAPPDEAQSKK